MSIQITQILDGGIDLETMQELPQSLLLSNGQRTALMAITKEQLQVVISLFDTVEEVSSRPINGKMVSQHVQEEDTFKDAETGVAAW